MAQRHQQGWLKKEARSQGDTWMLFFRTTRKFDRKRVENKIPIGRGCVTFADLAHHYTEHELVRPARGIHQSKGIHDYQRLRASAPQPTAATLG